MFHCLRDWALRLLDVGLRLQDLKPKDSDLLANSSEEPFGFPLGLNTDYTGA